MSNVGVLAIQGDFARHIESVERVGRPAIEVRTGEDLAKVERLIIPGGESTTVGLLLQRFGLAGELKAAAADGMPIWGTCMGLILMSRQIEDRPDQFTLGLLDVKVKRNAFGAQVHSFEAPVEIEGMAEPIMGVFIRAPIVTELGPDVKPLGCFTNKIVAVQQGKRVGTSFHPELTDDDRFLNWFLSL